MKRESIILYVVFFTLISLCFNSCSKKKNTSESLSTTLPDKKSSNNDIHIDLPELQKQKKIKVITSYSTTSYFIYKGQPLGFEYELLQRLAEDLGLELEIEVSDDLHYIFDALNKGECDLLAQGLTITKERQKKVMFTNPLMETKQVLVQRLPENYSLLSAYKLNKQLIRNPIELIGKKVYVRQGSSYQERLFNLSEEIGGDIEVVALPKVLEDELIGDVVDGKINYTIADENIALINATYYNNIDIATPISFPQRIAWAVRKTSPQLKVAIDDWFKKIKKTPIYNVTYRKYFKNKKSFQRRLNSEYFSKKGKRISKYDRLIKKYAEQINWDWRLLASLIYQESQFNPKAESWAGAKGLMQTMPSTAKSYKISNPYIPSQSLKGGVKYIKYLNSYWDNIPDSIQRVKFILASYNVGQGHVSDAKRLAEKYGANPYVWDNEVEKYILLKATKKYFSDDVVRYGYCRGREPYNYVREIIRRYEQYKGFILTSNELENTMAKK